MLDAIEKLLVLQDRDRKLIRLRKELERIEPERHAFRSKVATSQQALGVAKDRANHIEADRKKLELEVEGKKELIAKYSLQQFQTKKNEEYRALSKEINTCKSHIEKFEDQQLELMEQYDQAQSEITTAKKAAEDAKNLADSQVAELGKRETNLKAELQNLETDREAFASQVDEDVRSKYERLLEKKGEKTVVGIEHGVCGGCHMGLPKQVVVSCRGQHEIVMCPNCGRIVYYTKDMDLVVAD